ncbi:hypothetical protein PSTG_06541 [Puccinia striiformis f. sp. tritici PST-78]|uniref:DDE Tnp4 domain-containing protein n=1 Tax=Puccinia striiformis f. sp. tritici PST-78 TaxID=1165861 RepID=A0A0L0VLI2_9BASI|nr:hypothetical protein PSTG_06541 [Puccinia striiformis f. sp. tritici PST-78]
MGHMRGSDFGQLVRDGPSNTRALTNYKSPNLRSNHHTRKTNPTPTDRLQPSLVLTCLGMRNHSERQMVIWDLGLIIVWLDSQDSDLMVESAIGIRALPTISQLAFPRSPMLQKTFDTLFSEEAEAMDLLQQVLSHQYLEARRPPKSRGQYLLADSAYELTNTVIPSYKSPASNSSINTEFNYCVAKARVRNEHTIGILKARWSSLREICIILHNMLAQLGDQWQELDSEDQNRGGVDSIPEGQAGASEVAFCERVKNACVTYNHNIGVLPL